MNEYIDRFAALSILCKACGNKDCQKDVRQRCGWFKEMIDLPAAVPQQMSAVEYGDTLVKICAWHNGRCADCEIEPPCAIPDRRTVPIVEKWAAEHPEETLEQVGDGIYIDPKHRIVADEMTDVITVQLTSINSNNPTELSDGQIKIAMRRLEERLKEGLTDGDVRVTLWQQFITKSHEEEV